MIPSTRTIMNTQSKPLINLFLIDIWRPQWVRQLEQRSEDLDAYPNWAETLNVLFTNHSWMILFTLSHREYYWLLSITMTVMVSIKNKQLDSIQTPAVQMFSFWGSLVCSSWHIFSQEKKKKKCFPSVQAIFYENILHKLESQLTKDDLKKNISSKKSCSLC